MQVPRLFAPKADRRLTAERLGLRRHQALVQKVMEEKGRVCAFSGIESPVSDALPDGGMCLEVIDSRKPSGNANNIRLVDPLYYWSRHVESAIEQKKGVLIFAPWFTQSEVITMVRVSMIAKYFANRLGDDGHEKIGDTVLKHLLPLANDEIMLNALGMAPDVEQWQPTEWLNALRNLSGAERKRYNQTLAKNVRFLPDERQLEPWIAALAKAQYQTSGKGPRSWLDAASQTFTP